MPSDSHFSVLKRNRFWIAATSIWLVISLIAGTTAFLALGAKTVGDWLTLMRPMVLYYGIWAICSPIVFALVSNFSDSTSSRVLVVIAHLFLIGAISAVTPILVSPIGWQEWLYGFRAPAFHGLTALIYLIVVLAAISRKYYRRSQRVEKQMHEHALRSVQLENNLNLARFDALRMQINPHFLFNSLNSIGSLIESGRNGEAYRALSLLGELLRNVLDCSDEREIPLRAELDFVRSYVELEKLRYGSRLNLVLNVEAESSDRLIPPMVIQPLVENVVKHVVTQTDQPVRVDIFAGIDECNRLVVAVANNAMGGLGRAASSTGLGLANISERLRLIHGSGAWLAIDADQAFAVRIVVPPPVAAGVQPDGGPQANAESRQKTDDRSVGIERTTNTYIAEELQH